MHRYIMHTDTVRYCTWQSTTIPMSGASYPLIFCHPFACYSLTPLLSGKHKHTEIQFRQVFLSSVRRKTTQHTNLKQQSETKQKNCIHRRNRNLKLTNVSSSFIVRNIIRTQTTHQPDTWKKNCVIMKRVRKKRGRLYFHSRVTALISHTVD